VAAVHPARLGHRRVRPVPFRTVRARALKAKAETPFPEALSAEQVAAVLACCRRPRERFLVVLLLHTGLRIGEALGLRRCDMHLLPDSRGLGCPTVGAGDRLRGDRVQQKGGW
jgi:integrase